MNALTSQARARPRSAGFTLIELMIAMVLGLVVIGGVVSALLANKQNYRTNEGLSQIQESTRTAFELLARDIRQSNANGCNNTGRTANVLEDAAPVWWQNWFGLQGFNEGQIDPAVEVGPDEEQRAALTDSLQVQSVAGNGFSIKSHNAPGAELTLNEATTNIVAGDVLIVCDFDHSAILQATAGSGNDIVNYEAGSQVPGNCSEGLGFPTDCDSVSGNVYTFGPSSQVSRLLATDWYVGNNGRDDEGGRSLYRRTLGPGAILTTEEVVAGVTNMQLQYRLFGEVDFQDANLLLPAEWANVSAVSVTLTVDSADDNISTNSAVNDGRLQRRVTSVITLRNRVP